MMMWPLAAASSLRALSTSVPFYASPPPLPVRRVFGGSGQGSSAVYLGLSLGPKNKLAMHHYYQRARNPRKSRIAHNPSNCLQHASDCEQ